METLWALLGACILISFMLWDLHRRQKKERYPHYTILNNVSWWKKVLRQKTWSSGPK